MDGLYARVGSVVRDSRGTVAGKLVLAFGISLLLVAALAIGHEMRGDVQASVREMTEAKLTEDALIDETLHVIEHIRQANLLHVIARSQEEMDEAGRERSQLVASLGSLRVRYGEVAFSPREREAVEGLFASIDRFVAVTERTVELSRAGRKDEARQWIMDQGTPAYLAAETRTHVLEAQVEAESQKVLAEIDRIHATFGQRSVLLTALSLIVAFVFYVLRVRSVTRPLKQLKSAAEQVAAGRLDMDLDIDAPDEIGHLADSFTRMTRSLRQRFRDMEGLVEVGRSVLSSLSLDDLLLTIAERGRILLGSDQAGICLRSEVDAETELRTSTFPAGDAWYETAKRESEVHLRAIYADRTPRVAHNVAGFATVLFVPLLTEERMIGVMAFFGQAGWEVDGWRLRVAGMLAQKAAVAIEKARLQANLADSYLSTITALAAAVEAKDSYTSSHCERLADYGVAVACQLDMSPQEVETVRRGCLLHDIGKIGIRDEILLKPDRLTPEEYEEIKSHTTRGEAIVAAAPFLHDVAVLVRHHHEYWNGHGYPDGLKGEEIPLGARIVAVVDAFEAMTSDRPYRGAMSRERAIEEIRRCAGTQFDSAVVAVFLSVLQAGGERRV